MIHHFDIKVSPDRMGLSGSIYVALLSRETDADGAERIVIGQEWTTERELEQLVATLKADLDAVLANGRREFAKLPPKS